MKGKAERTTAFPPDAIRVWRSLSLVERQYVEFIAQSRDREDIPALLDYGRIGITEKEVNAGAGFVVDEDGRTEWIVDLRRRILSLCTWRYKKGSDRAEQERLDDWDLVTIYNTGFAHCREPSDARRVELGLPPVEGGMPCYDEYDKDD